MRFFFVACASLILAFSGNFSEAYAQRDLTLAQLIDEIIAYDSNRWVMNRYDYGSVTGAHVDQATSSGQSGILHANYTYNGGSSGWIKVHITGGRIDCLEYHDFPGTCRALGRPSSVDFWEGFTDGFIQEWSRQNR